MLDWKSRHLPLQVQSRRLLVQYTTHRVGILLYTILLHNSNAITLASARQARGIGQSLLSEHQNSLWVMPPSLSAEIDAPPL